MKLNGISIGCSYSAVAAMDPEFPGGGSLCRQVEVDFSDENWFCRSSIFSSGFGFSIGFFQSGVLLPFRFLSSRFLTLLLNSKLISHLSKRSMYSLSVIVAKLTWLIKVFDP